MPIRKISKCPAIVKATSIQCGNPSKYGEYCGVHKRVGEEIQREKDEISKRISKCEGDGTCLEQIGEYSYKECGHCVPVGCPRCRCKLPQWVRNCHRGYCINCAIEEYSKNPVEFMKRK